MRNPLLQWSPLVAVFALAMMGSKPAAAGGPYEYVASWQDSSTSTLYQAEFNLYDTSFTATNQSSAAIDLLQIYLSGPEGLFASNLPQNWAVSYGPGSTIEAHNANGSVGYYGYDYVLSGSLGPGASPVSFGTAGTVNRDVNDGRPFAAGFSGNVVVADAASVKAVPEPAFFQLAALLGLGGLAMLRLRRRA